MTLVVLGLDTFQDMLMFEKCEGKAAIENYYFNKCFQEKFKHQNMK